MNILKSKIDEWQSMRKLTLDLFEIIPEEKLGFTVGENMGTNIVILEMFKFAITKPLKQEK